MQILLTLLQTENIPENKKKHQLNSRTICFYMSSSKGISYMYV